MRGRDFTNNGATINGFVRWAEDLMARPWLRISLASYATLLPRLLSPSARQEFWALH